MLGWRERDLSNAYLPFLSGEGCAQFFSDPVFRSRLERPPEEDILAAAAAMLATFPNLDLTWDDLDWLRAQTELPLLVKGVLAGEDAVLAFEHGADGVDRVEPRRPAGGRLRRRPRRARRGTCGGRRGRSRADGRGHPPWRRRAQGACARRRRGAARAAVRLRAGGRRSGGRRDRDPAPHGGHRCHAGAPRRRGVPATWTRRGSRRSPNRAGPRGRRARARPAGARRGARPDRSERRLPHRPAHHRDRWLGTPACQSCSATRGRAWSRRSARGSYASRPETTSSSAGARPVAPAPGACAELAICAGLLRAPARECGSRTALR